MLSRSPMKSSRTSLSMSRRMAILLPWLRARRRGPPERRRYGARGLAQAEAQLVGLGVGEGDAKGRFSPLRIRAARRWRVRNRRRRSPSSWGDEPMDRSFAFTWSRVSRGTRAVTMACMAAPFSCFWLQYNGTPNKLQ